MNLSFECDLLEVNPNPVIIFSKTGQLLKSNSASDLILKYWNINVGEFLKNDLWHGFINKTNKKNKELDINIGAYIFSIRIVHNQQNILFFGQDITSSVTIRRKLQNIDESYRLIAQHSSDIISRQDKEYNIVYISPSSKVLLNYEIENLLAKPFLELIHEEDQIEYTQAFKNVLNDEKSTTINFRILCQDGQYKWFESILKKIKNQANSINEILCISRDITQRMNISKALRESEELYKSVVNNLGEGLIVVDTKGIINFTNNSMEIITEKSADEMLGRNLSELINKKGYAIVDKKLTTRLQGISEVYEFLAEFDNGNSKWLEVKSTPYKNLKGNIIGAIAAITDVTSRKRQEQEIAKLSMVASKTDNGIVITNHKGEIEWINDSFTKISGYTIDEIFGQKPGKILQGPETNADTILEIRNKLTSGKSFDILILNYSKDKKTYWSQIEITPVKDELGNIVSYFSIQRDITEKIQTLELLKESEQRYKNLLSASFEGIVVHKNGIVIDCNQRFASMLGYSHEEVVNNSIYKFLPEEYSNSFFLPDVNLDNPKEYIAVGSDKKSFPVEIITKSHQYKKTAARVTLIMDLSERIKTLEKLKESELRYRELVETSSNFIYTVNEHGNFLYVNAVGIKKTGYSLQKLQNMNFIEVLAPSRRADVVDFYKKQFDNKIRESYFELPIITASGEEIWLGQNVQMTIENNWIIGFQAYARDITERKNIEIELDKQKYLMNMILDILPIPVFLKNKEGKYLFVNNEAKKFYQNPTNEESQIPAEIFPEDYFEDYEQLNDTTLKEKKIEINKVEKYLLLGKKMIKPDLINDAMLLGYFIDISDRKKAEEALIQAKQTAEESMLAKERFISIMSHEIRTPMNAVVGITNLLVQQSHTEEQKEYLHALKTSSDNLLKILNNILDLSKLESGKISFEEITFDIREILSEVQETFKFKAAEKNIEIKNIVSSFVPTLLKGDPLRLHQVLVNLVSNALKFTSEGKIILEISKINETERHLHLKFSVKDTGIGIPKNKLVEIFESFTQVSSDTSRKYGGTGLGLTITKRLIELQGGKIHVESELDKGSIFIFDLTFSKTNQLRTGLEIEKSYDLAGTKLLLVEDNEMNQLVVLKFLEKEKIDVVIAENGLRATEVLETKRFDIILMDLQMPVMDGYEATKYIREKKNVNTNIPIIAFTASSGSDIETKIKQSGMNDYITKPFEPGKLYSIITKYLKKENLKPKKISIPKILPVDMSEKSRKVINLDYLKEASNGNTAFIKNMIEIFLKQTPIYLKELTLANKEKDWDKLKKTIHKMKPTIPMMGIKMQHEVGEIEDAAKNLQNLESITFLLDKLIFECEAAYIELNEALLSLH